MQIIGAHAALDPSRQNHKTAKGANREGQKVSRGARTDADGNDRAATDGETSTVRVEGGE